MRKFYKKVSFIKVVKRMVIPILQPDYLGVKTVKDLTLR